jgi:hypothetical protein
MTSSFEYRKRARDCVELAQGVRKTDRPRLLHIAQVWLNLADQRAVEEADPWIVSSLAKTQSPRAS